MTRSEKRWENAQIAMLPAGIAVGGSTTLALNWQRILNYDDNRDNQGHKISLKPGQHYKPEIGPFAVAGEMVGLSLAAALVGVLAVRGVRSLVRRNNVAVA